MVGGALDAGGWKWRAAWAGVLVLAAANFFAGLGSSSLFVDESISWELARAPIGDLLRSVREIEVTPPTYHLFLHEWLWRGGGGEAPGEAFMRLPSALAGVALVGVTGWLGTVVADRRAGLVAAALAAASPLVLAYAQQVRVYAFAMLLCAVCAAAAIELSRADRARAGRRRLWLALALASAAGALWLHYLSLLAIGPIVLWAATRPGLPARERAVLTGGTALAFAVTSRCCSTSPAAATRRHSSCRPACRARTCCRCSPTPSTGATTSSTSR